MADKKDRLDPSTTSFAYDEMVPRWAKMKSVLGGTDTMRAAAQLYLPQHTEEKIDAYNERLMRSTFFNVVKITLGDMVGRPFSDPVQVSEDMPKVMEPILEDVDLLGNDVNVFSRNWFMQSLAKAFSHVLVDFPRVLPKEDGQPRTVEDDRIEKLRPYWVHIPPENILFARFELRNGVEVLTHVRIWEVVTESDGFAEVQKVRIRVLEPGRTQFWVPTKQKRNNKPIWVMQEEFATDLDFIPLVTFYSNREDFMVGTPELSDLADLNIQHWQSMSDQIAVLTVARFPILALSGAAPADQDVIKVGPRKWLHTSDSQGKYYYVEHTGAAIGAGRTDLLDLEDRMANFGSQFLKKRPGGQTATARALDSAESISPLQDMIMRFTDALNLVLIYTAKWLKLKDKEVGTITVNTEFGPEEVQEADFRALLESRKNRDISRVTLLNELKRRGTLEDEFDPEVDAALLEKERMEIDDVTSKLDLDPGASDDDNDDDDNKNKDAQ